MFNFAVNEGLLVANPLKKFREASGRTSRTDLEPEEKKEIRAAIRDGHSANSSWQCEETGDRPMEVATVMAADVDLECGLWTLQNHKTASQTGKPHVIYLSPAVLELTKKLMLKNPEGPLFRSPRGNRPFTHRGIRSALPPTSEEAAPSQGRRPLHLPPHSATDALALGVPVATVAALLAQGSEDGAGALWSPFPESGTLAGSRPPRSPTVRENLRVQGTRLHLAGSQILLDVLVGEHEAAPAQPHPPVRNLALASKVIKRAEADAHCFAVDSAVYRIMMDSSFEVVTASAAGSSSWSFRFHSGESFGSFTHGRTLPFLDGFPFLVGAGDSGS